MSVDGRTCNSRTAVLRGWSGRRNRSCRRSVPSYRIWTCPAIYCRGTRTPRPRRARKSSSLPRRARQSHNTRRISGGISAPAADCATCNCWSVKHNRRGRRSARKLLENKRYVLFVSLSFSIFRAPYREVAWKRDSKAAPLTAELDSFASDPTIRNGLPVKNPFMANTRPWNFHWNDICFAREKFQSMALVEFRCDSQDEYSQLLLKTVLAFVPLSRLSACASTKTKYHNNHFDRIIIW